MGFLDSLIGFAPYAQGAVQRHDQRALQALAQQRQAMIDKQNATLATANAAHLDAETDALRSKPAPRDPVSDANAKWDHQVGNPKPGVDKPTPMLKTVDENGLTVYTPSTQAAGKQAPTAPTPQEPMVVTVGPDGKRSYTPRSKAAGMAAPAPTPPPDRTLVQTQDPSNPTGPAVLTPRAQAAGMHTPAKAPTNAAGSAQVNREADYVKLMEQSLPQMEALSGKVRPAAIVAALTHPTAGNAVLNQDEQTYLLNARTFLAGVLHQESGARLSDAQVAFGLQRYLPNLQDSPETVQQKTAAARKVYEGRKATLAPGKSSGNIDLGAPTAPASPARKPVSDADRQHAAQDPQFAAWLKAHGYEVP